ncbi:MAG TPA: hypothetical protein VM513_10230 [Kofleriaceae bacterium]|jgi:hypothetical protein|nr:hypothetical protein [Kofleriaceae bacterium]
MRCASLLALASSACVTGVTVTHHATLAPDATAPSFTLPAQDGTQVSLARTLEAGHAVLVFYRGFW